MRLQSYFLLNAAFLLSLLLAGCRAANDPAAEVVIAYQKALIGGDFNQLALLTCATWETQARTEFDSFAAVKATLDGVACHTRGKEGNTAVVQCTGKIVANYGNEVMDIDLAAHTYLAANEGGEWRMCGYR